MSLSLRDLRYFEIAAEAGHLGRAAETIARSQPALTKAIHRLEATVGGPLFERAGRGVRLTPVGHVLLERARDLRVVASEALRQVAEFAEGTAGLVRIGCGTVTIDGLLPRVSTLLLAQAPKAQVTIEVGPSMELHEKLRRRQLDLVVGLVPEGSDPMLETHPILDDDVVVVARRGHPVFRQPATDMARLVECHWVLTRPDAPSRQWLDSVFEANDLPRPIVQIETNSIPLLPQLIAGTDLLSFVSRHLIGTGHKSVLREIPLVETTLRRRLGVTHRRDGYLSPAARRMIGLLESEAPLLSARKTRSAP